jgi:hypothetical protein
MESCPPEESLCRAWKTVAEEGESFMAWSVVRVAFFPFFVPVAAGFVFAVFL